MPLAEGFGLSGLTWWKFTVVLCGLKDFICALTCPSVRSPDCHPQGRPWLLLNRLNVDVGLGVYVCTLGLVCIWNTLKDLCVKCLFGPPCEATGRLGTFKRRGLGQNVQATGDFQGTQDPSVFCLFAFALISVCFALSFLLSGCEVSSLLCSWPHYGTLQTNEQGMERWLRG